MARKVIANLGVSHSECTMFGMLVESEVGEHFQSDLCRLRPRAWQAVVCPLYVKWGVFDPRAADISYEVIAFLFVGDFKGMPMRGRRPG